MSDREGLFAFLGLLAGGFGCLWLRCAGLGVAGVALLGVPLFLALACRLGVGWGPLALGVTQGWQCSPLGAARGLDDRFSPSPSPPTLQGGL